MANVKPFFESIKHPGLIMNKYGVVLAPRSDSRANTEIYCGVDWTHVPLKNGNLDVRQEVEYEAIDAGYTHRYVNGERVYSKPKATCNG